jgi:D-alanyl-D-alanine carboxypeptidase/D-alanyl-D-alanine-endopeptidase (penicillin-binding protein 4)
MDRHVRRVLSALVLACALAPPGASAHAGGAPADKDLGAAVRACAAAVKDARVGIVVLDVDSNKVLAQTNEHELLNPASNAKLYTAAAALAILRGEHRFETSLSGKAKGDAVQGPIVLRGHGDPSLRTEDLHAMAVELVARGVRKIEGDVLVDQAFWDEQTTPPAFDQKPSEWSAFRAPISAVAVNENTITLTVRPGEPGGPARAWFDPPGFVDVEGAVKTAGSGADSVILKLFPNGGRLGAHLAGAIGEDAKFVRFTRRVDDPRLLPGYVLRAELDQLGVKVGGDVKLGTSSKATTLVRHVSQPLSALLFELGKQSDNFYAEMIFKSIAAEAKGRPGKSQDAADMVQRWVESIGASDNGLVIKNGSGLYDANRVTAHSVTQLLRHAWRSADLQPDFVAQLAVGGADGTLRKRLRAGEHRRIVRAKTGTLDDVAALSGYVLGPPGKGPIAFAIIFNGVGGHVSDARAAADKLVQRIVAAHWAE